ncbi:MAG: STAS domain-containing protein [Candidatus Methylumidiphilus sp.]|nr:STAS domain-containing protein [Pseudomonadota bacterium]
MNITLDNKDDSTLLRFHEERLDAHNSKELKDYLLTLYDNGAKKLILDLSEVRFVDSSGLGALLSGHKNAGLRDGRFALACVQSRVQSMFELTRLTRVFEIYPGVEDALANGAGGTPHDSKQD